MSHFNKGKLHLKFVDATDQGLKDDVKLTFENFFLKSLNFRTTIDSFPATITDLVAAPQGLWQVHVQPEHYRAKTFFVNVKSKGKTEVTEKFLLEPSQVKPQFPTVDEMFSEQRWQQLAALLSNSDIFDLSDQRLWQHLITERPLLAAGLLNLHARTQFVKLNDGLSVFSYFQKLVLIKQDRIFTIVDSKLHSEVLKTISSGTFNRADGSLHTFPDGFIKLEQDTSFKTPERVGNLQLTFARHATEGVMMVDADVDDAQGIKHAFDVIKHIFTGSQTHPYDIQQILLAFYDGLDVGYVLKLL